MVNIRIFVENKPQNPPVRLRSQINIRGKDGIFFFATMDQHAGREGANSDLPGWVVDHSVLPQIVRAIFFFSCPILKKNMTSCKNVINSCKQVYTSPTSKNVYKIMDALH